MSNLPPGCTIGDIERAMGGTDPSRHSESVYLILEDAGFPEDVIQCICKIIDDYDIEESRFCENCGGLPQSTIACVSCRHPVKPLEDNTDYASIDDPATLFVASATYTGAEVLRRLELWNEAKTQKRVSHY